MNRHLPPPRLRRLPHTLAPLHRESWDSYVSRLATANRISHLELHEHINDRHRIHPAPLPLLDAISHLSGHPHDRLLKALPDLRTSDLARGLPAACQLLDDGWHVQAVCTLCLAAKGVFTGPATGSLKAPGFVSATAAGRTPTTRSSTSACCPRSSRHSATTIASSANMAGRRW